MLYHSELSPEPPSTTTSFSLHLRARSTEEALRGAVAEVVARHPVLRTSFNLAVSGSRSRSSGARWRRRSPPAISGACRPGAGRRRGGAWLDRRAPPQLRLGAAAAGALPRPPRAVEEQLPVHPELAPFDPRRLERMDSLRLIRRSSPRARGAAGPPLRGAAAGLDLRDFVALERDLAAGEARRPAALLATGRSRRRGRPTCRAGRPRSPRCRASREVAVALAAGCRGAHSARPRRPASPFKSVLLAVHLRAAAASSPAAGRARPALVDQRPARGGGRRRVLRPVPQRAAAPRCRARRRRAGGARRRARPFAPSGRCCPYRRFPLGRMLQAAIGGPPLFEIAFNFVHFHVYAGRGLAGRSRSLGEERRGDRLRCWAQLRPRPRRGRLACGSTTLAASSTPSRSTPRRHLPARARGRWPRSPGRTRGGAPRRGGAPPDPGRGERPAQHREGLPVHRAFSSQAARTPEAVALSRRGAASPTASWTAGPNRLARHLRAPGVVHRDAGGALRSSVRRSCRRRCWGSSRRAAPTCRSIPPTRRSASPSCSRIPAPAGARRAAARPARRRPRDRGGDRGRRCRDGGEARRRGDPRDPAYAIYTSGSTGRPKGVLVEHRSLAATLAASQRQLGLDAGDRMPCLAPFAFDIFLFELLDPLLAGGTLVLLPGLRATLDAARTSVCAPGRFHPPPRRARPDAADRSTRWRRRRPSRPAHPVRGGRCRAGRAAGRHAPDVPRSRGRILYGPTEGTIVCTSHRVPPQKGNPTPLLGRPLPGAEIQLRDESGGLVPAGVRARSGSAAPAWPAATSAGPSSPPRFSRARTAGAGLPHRRPRPLAPRRRAGVPRPRRRPGEDPRFPRRAGRGRGGPRRLPRGGRGRGGGPRRRWRQAAGRLPGAPRGRAGGRRAARAPPRPASRLHDALGLRDARLPPPVAQRQGGPPRPPRSGLERLRPARARRPAHRHRGAAGRPLVRDPGGGTDRPARLLPGAGGAVAPRHAAHHPAARRLRRRPAAARPL